MRARILHGLAAILALPAAAQAEVEAVPAAASLSYNIGIVSDYHFRGISFSNRQPAVQGGVDVALRSGLFAGVWASSLADYGGANVEVDLYAGYAGKAAGFDYGATVYGYVYPGGHSVDSFELQSTLARTVGPLTTTLMLAFAPDQRNSSRDSLYVNLGADLAIGDSPLTASIAVGRENGSYDEKWDWSAGLTYRLDVLDISASYVDSNYDGALEAGRNGGAGVVLGVKASF